MSLFTELCSSKELRDNILNTDYLLMQGTYNSSEATIKEMENNELMRLSSLVLFSILVAKEAGVPYSSICDKMPQVAYVAKLEGDTKDFMQKGIMLADRFCKGDNSIYQRMVGFSIYVASVLCNSKEDTSVLKGILSDWGKSTYDTIIKQIVRRGSTVKYIPYFGEPTKILKGMGVDLRIDGTIYNILFEDLNDYCIAVLIGAFNCNQSKYNKYKLKINDIGVINLKDIKVDKISTSVNDNLVSFIDNYLDNLLRDC